MKNDNKCPFDVLANMISGKWKMIILWHINKDGFKRFGELKKITNNASSKVLTDHLRQLETDGLIERKVYAEIPPRVEYYATDLGRSLWPILKSMQQWGIEYFEKSGLTVEPYIIEEFKNLD